MQLLTNEQRQRMLENGRVNAAHIARDGDTRDFAPVVKLFCPWATGTWLLSELHSDDHDIAFGLCDLGHPELGGVRLSELAAVRGPGRLGIERDLRFRAAKSLSEYAAEARERGFIAA